MATKKKASSKESTPSEKPARKKKAVNEKTVVKGTHLTVTKWPCGYTELEWDDAALLREVQEATK